jgi:hypothetical protein
VIADHMWWIGVGVAGMSISAMLSPTRQNCRAPLHRSTGSEIVFA